MHEIIADILLLVAKLMSGRGLRLLGTIGIDDDTGRQTSSTGIAILYPIRHHDLLDPLLDAVAEPWRDDDQEGVARALRTAQQELAKVEEHEELVVCTGFEYQVMSMVLDGIEAMGGTTEISSDLWLTEGG